MEENVQAAPQQAPSDNSSGSPIMKIIIIVVLLGVLAGGGYLAYSFLQKPGSPTTPGTGKSLLDVVNKGSAQHYMGSQTITLEDISRGGNSGNATRSMVAGNNFLVVYANLPDPEEGKFYQTWVARGDNSIHSGKLFKFDPSTYSSVSNYAFDLTNPPFEDFDSLYNTVIVSQESLDDNVMETKLLEGTFTK